MTNPLVSCLCTTYGRPLQLGEAIKCFIDQSYENKELIVLNDQEGVALKLEDCPSNIQIINHPTRFKSLGEKRNYIKDLAKKSNPEYYCVWDDDDLYTPWRICDSVEAMRKNPYQNIAKGKNALFSTHNADYKLLGNLFHAQSCVRKEYMDKTNYPCKSVGEDRDFEKGAMVISIEISPLVWYVYRWGNGVHHLSGMGEENEKISWEKSLYFEEYNEVVGDIIIEPKFARDYWADIYEFYNARNPKWGNIWQEKINE